MTWRTVIIQKSSKLSLQNQQLLIDQRDEKYSVPLEDIAIIIIESREVLITVPLLSALAQYGITLLTCDEQFLPCGQWLSFGQYHRPLKILSAQLNATLPFKKQLWQMIVRQKIINQAWVLQYAGNKIYSHRLLNQAQEVKSGDKTHLESQSAALYFPQLFGQSFARNHDNNSINAHLNYAYTILRSAIARSLVSYGFNPALGVNHHNQLNAFNLADDLIEPFRPIVDFMMFDLIKHHKIENELTPKTKQYLISILNHQIQWKNEIYNVLSAIDKTITTLQAAFLHKDPKKLTLPQLVELKEHYYE